MLNLLQEIYFWSGIMRDHSEFIITALSCRELEYARSAKDYQNAFIALHQDVATTHHYAELPYTAVLINRSVTLLNSFIGFKKIILKKLLECDIEINLPPTFVNHMINEALEFYRVLCLAANAGPWNITEMNIHLHKIWLPDAAGHAATIAADLDPTEAELIKTAESFRKDFDNLFIKATELGQMLERACLDAESLKFLNEQVEEKINEFMCYLGRIRELRQKCKALGSINPLVPDHMIREEKYYLSKITDLKR